MASAVTAGSLGTMLAFWREKTFQSLAITLLALVVWMGLGEALAAGALGESLAGFPAADWATAISPWRATLWATRSLAQGSDSAATSLGGFAPADLFLAVAALVTILLNGITIALVRVWNPSSELRLPTLDADEAERQPAGGEHHWRLAPDAAAADLQPAAAVTTKQQRATATAGATARQPASRGRTRQVWDNPILSREIRTWAYGRKMLLIRLAYLLLFAASAAGLYLALSARCTTMVQVAFPMVPFFVLSLVLVNVQSVTALTAERDARAIDLLLVTDLTPGEFIFGKLWRSSTTPRKWCCCRWPCAYTWRSSGRSRSKIRSISSAVGW